jgi:protein-tyrosine phosphatase
MNFIPFERSYWVIANRLLAGEIPAARSEEESRMKLSSLVNANVNVIINLMEEDERNYRNEPFFDYSAHLKPENVVMHRMPIRDLSIPSKEHMLRILDVIDEALNNNKVVYVHCWGGVGRTGTVIGCYLMRHGMANNANVIETIEYLKRTTSIAERESPETEEQQLYLRNWQE